MWKNVSQPWNGCVFNSLIPIKVYIIYWLITNLTVFICKTYHGHPGGGIWLFLTWQALSKTVKIHPSSVHASSYGQKMSDFIYLCLHGTCCYLLFYRYCWFHQKTVSPWKQLYLLLYRYWWLHWWSVSPGQLLSMLCYRYWWLHWQSVYPMETVVTIVL